MSILDKYKNMTCTIKRAGETRDPRFGVYNTSAEETINCFVYGELKLLRNAQGEMTTSVQTILTTEEVKIGDIINGHEVISVNPLPNLQGVIEFYEVTL